MLTLMPYFYEGDIDLVLNVKTYSNAHILLSPCDDCDGYEIVIGGWVNTQSVIRDGKQSHNFAVTQVVV